MLRTILVALGVMALTAPLLPRLHAEGAGQGAPIRAQIPQNLGLDWDQGILPIGQLNYYKAIDCGKQSGDNPICLFYDAGLCKNADFELALYTPYKYVAYEVWNAVRQKKPVPTPNYAQAGRTRVTLGISPVKGSANQITSVAIKKAGKTFEPTSRSVDGANTSFTFDFAPWTPTADITIEMVGKTGTKSCIVPRGLLQRFR